MVGPLTLWPGLKGNDSELVIHLVSIFGSLLFHFYSYFTKKAQEINVRRIWLTSVLNTLIFLH